MRFMVFASLLAWYTAFLKLRSEFWLDVPPLITIALSGIRTNR